MKTYDVAVVGRRHRGPRDRVAPAREGARGSPSSSSRRSARPAPTRPATTAASSTRASTTSPARRRRRRASRAGACSSSSAARTRSRTRSAASSSSRRRRTSCRASTSSPAAAARTACRACGSWSRPEFREIEPHAAGVTALHVPPTGITDYGLVARTLAALARAEGRATCASSARVTDARLDAARRSNRRGRTTSRARARS